MATNRQISTKFRTLVRIKSAPTLGLAGFFPVRSEDNVQAGEAVEFDIEKTADKMAVPVPRHDKAQNSTVGGFVTKTFVPPYYRMQRPVNVADFSGRQAGEDMYQAILTDKATKLYNRVGDYLTSMRELIERAIEWQAAQVLQLGKIQFKTLLNSAVDDLDFEIDASMYSTALPDWTGATWAEKTGQLEAVCDLVHEKGKANPDNAIFGAEAWNNFSTDAGFIALLNLRRGDIGALVSESVRNDGLKYRGWIEIGSYVLNLWTYSGTYVDPITNAITKYFDPKKVVIISSGAERDRYHGGVDILIKTPAEIANLVPGLGQIASRERADFHYWLSTDEGKKQTYAGCDSAPLCVPTNIYGHAAITVLP